MTQNELPVGWVKCSFRDISSLIRGVSYQKSHIVEPSNISGVCLLRANNIQNARIIFDDLVYVKENKINPDQTLQNGDIIIAMSSGSKHLVGKSALFSGNSKATTFGAFCGTIRPFSQINHQFMAYYLQTKEYQQIISALSKGININNLKRDHILNLIIKLPPLAEQKRIVGKIEELFAEVDKGIDLLKQKQAELKKYRQSVLSTAFSGKLYKTTEWQTVQLKEVCEFKSGNTIDAKLEKSTGTIPYVKVGDMNLTENSISITTSTRFVNPGDIKQNQIIPIGSIVFPKRGGAIATNKKRKVVRPIIIDLNTMALIPTQKLNTDFFYFWMQKIDLIKLSNGGNIPQINNYSFDGVEIFLPSLPEQEQIVAEIEQRFEKADILEKSIEDALESAEKLKQSILKKAFEGKLVPQDPNDEPASVPLGSPLSD